MTDPDHSLALSGSLFTLLEALVAAPSPQPEGNTEAPAAVIEAALAAADLPFRRVVFAPGKPNIVSTIDTGRPGPHLIFNGHLDTLSPGREADWSVPLYRMSHAEDRLTGLGIGNMKAGVAALTRAFIALADEVEGLQGKLTLALVADEVVFGPDGAAALLASEPDLIGDLVINAEGPGAMGLAIAEKGLGWWRIEASSAPGQGMLNDRGQSAVTRLAQFLMEIDGWNSREITPPAGLEALAGERGRRLSVNVGMIAGGHFVSQIATPVTAEIDIRLPVGLTLAEVEAELAAVAARIGGIGIKRLKGWEPSATLPDTPLVNAMQRAIATLRGKPAPLVCRLPASDAQRWRANGVPAVCFGPQPLLASGIDDFVLEQDVLACCAIYRLAAETLLARTE